MALEISRPKETGEVIRFSAEARNWLEREGYFIYALEGKSIRELRQSGLIQQSPYLEHPDFQQQQNWRTPATEVAIRWAWLDGSWYKTLPEQERMVADFSRKLSKKVKGVKAIIGQASQYTEVALLHFKATGKRIFGWDQDYSFTRTLTSAPNGEMGFVGFFSEESGLLVGFWPPNDRTDEIRICPLVVPEEFSFAIPEKKAEELIADLQRWNGLRQMRDNEYAELYDDLYQLIVLHKGNIPDSIGGIRVVDLLESLDKKFGFVKRMEEVFMEFMRKCMVQDMSRVGSSKFDVIQLGYSAGLVSWFYEILNRPWDPKLRKSVDTALNYVEMFGPKE